MLYNTTLLPEVVLKTVLAVADAMALAVAIARDRLASHHDPFLRTSAETEFWRTRALRLQQENLILRNRLRRIPPPKRPRYSAHERFRILWLMRLHSWSVRKAAQHFVLDRKTISRWLKTLQQGSKKCTRLLGAPPVNRIPDLLRLVVHTLRDFEPH